jgi:hypothetical protein
VNFFDAKKRSDAKHEREGRTKRNHDRKVLGGRKQMVFLGRRRMREIRDACHGIRGSPQKRTHQPNKMRMFAFESYRQRRATLLSSL